MLKTLATKPSITWLNSIMIGLLGFSFLFSVALGNILLFLILLLWLVEGDFSRKYDAVKNNILIHAVFCFFGLHLLGLLWTSDWSLAGFVLKKEMKYLMLPILMTALLKEHFYYYFGSFLLAMLIMVGISYGLYFNVIPYYQFLSIRDATDPIPFVHHIVYTPVLAFALYFLLYALFLSNQVNGVYKKMGIGITLMMGINLFLNGGRAGQIVFLVLLVLFVFQYFAGDLKKSLMISLLAVSCIVPSAYFLSSSVNHRVQQAIQEIDHYEDNPNTSAGLRVVMVLNSLKIIEQHPLLGVGTGDYKQEYAKVSQIHSPDATQGEVFTHPHNVYIEEMVNFGVFGLAVLLYMFYAMFALYKRSVSVLKPVLLAFPLFYAVIFLSDGYIMNHYLTIFFLFFAAILYSGKWDGEKKIT